MKSNYLDTPSKININLTTNLLLETESSVRNHILRVHSFMSWSRFVVKLVHFEQKLGWPWFQENPNTSRPLQDALLEAMNAKIGGMKAVVFHLVMNSLGLRTWNRWSNSLCLDMTLDYYLYNGLMHSDVRSVLERHVFIYIYIWIYLYSHMFYIHILKSRHFFCLVRGGLGNPLTSETRQGSYLGRMCQILSNMPTRKMHSLV